MPDPTATPAAVAATVPPKPPLKPVPPYSTDYDKLIYERMGWAL